MSDRESNEATSFTTFLALGTVIVFRSATVREAAETAVVAALILLLCRVFRKTGNEGITILRLLLCEGVATVVSLFVFIGSGMLFPSGHNTGMAVVGEILYAFLFVPMIADRIKIHRNTSSGRTIILALLFSVTILSFASVRELGALGTMGGEKIAVGFFGKTPYLAHDSSAALILAALMIGTRLILRRHGGEGRSFTGYSDRKAGVPYLDAVIEKEQFRIASLLLLGTLLLGSLVLLAVYVSKIFALPAFLLPPFAVLAQAGLVGLSMVFRGIYTSRFAETIRRPFILPLQAAVVLGPLPFLFENGPVSLTYDGLRYAVSLLVLFFLCAGLVSFVRVFKRKMLFGHRPKSVDGLPFVFIIISLGLIVLSAFFVMPGGIV